MKIIFRLTIAMIMVSMVSRAFAQNPTVQNGVATYHSNKNIGQKFQVPNSWDKIVIKENVTITGSFYFPTRTTPMEIAGESRVTSVIIGDGTRPTDDGINGRSYSAIRFDKSPDVYIHDLRSLNPMKFHISAGFGQVTVERCDLIEDRGTHTTDGIHGGNQNVTVRDCYINTWDDALYTRECVLVENTTIVHNKNGSPFMTSWNAGLDPGSTCIVRNCQVIDNHDGTNYNHGIFAWAGKGNNSPMVNNIVFEGTFVRTVAPGKVPSTVYTIGRPNGGSNIQNATLRINGLCPYSNSVEIRPGQVNCAVEFVNCSGGGNAQPIAGLIQAESFSNQSGTQTESTSDNGGGQNVGFINNGDWTEYDVDVSQSGTYNVDLRVASGSSGGTVTVRADGTNVGSVNVSGTGGWQNWTTVSTQVNLSAGTQTLRLEYSGSGFLFNVNWVDFSVASGGGISNGTYFLEVRHSNKYVEVAGASTANGGNIQQWANQSGTHKQWTVTNVSGEWYSFINVNSNKALDVANFSTSNGGNIHQWNYSGNDNQLWRFDDKGGGWYQLISKHSGLALDVAGGVGATQNGANIQQWGASNNFNQQFRLISTSGARLAGEEVVVLKETTADHTSFELYPNPTTGILRVRQVDNNAILKISDLTGRIIRSMPAKPQIDISDLKPGTYFIEIPGRSIMRIIKE